MPERKTELKVVNFSPGINNELDPILLEPNVSVDLVNAEVLTGALVPLTDKFNVGDPGLPKLTNQDGNRSIVRFGNHYFWSDNDTGVLGSTLGYFGITPPSSLPIGLPTVRGTRFNGTYRYRFRYCTDDGNCSASGLPGEPQVLEVEAVIDGVVLTAGDFPTYNSLRYLGRSRGRRRYGYSAGERVTHNGLSWQLKSSIYLTTEIPSGKAPGGTFDLWSDITSRTIVAGGYDSIIISQFPQSNQAGVTSMQIERTLVNGSTFYFLGEVDINDAAYTDVKSDGELLTADQLPDIEYFAPIYELQSNVYVQDGGKFLTEVNERFLLAVGTRVYESKQGDPHSWRLDSRLNFDGEVTGIASLGDGYVVFVGEGQPYYVSGTIEGGDIKKERFDTTIGLTDWRTIAYIHNTPVWLSHEGLAGVTRLPEGQGKRIDILTRGRYVFDENPNFALAHGAEYFLFYDDGTVVVDFDRNHIHRSSLTAQYGYYSNENGKLYLVENQKFYQHDGGEALTITYTSPRFSMGDPFVLKSWKRIQFFSEADVTCTVWYDREVVCNACLVTKKPAEIMELKLPHANAYTIEVEVVVNGVFRGYSIDYEEVA